MTDIRHNRSGDYMQHDERSLVLPSSLHAPAIARQHLHELTDRLPHDILEAALLAVSEVVSNAVLHGAPDIVLEIRLAPDELLVGVTDSEAALPPAELIAPAPDRPSGRGLLIVDALATRWGVHVHDECPGKSVWFTFALE
jgi:anti-sigma regulatory factor (Ser/Thr protein kinase)